MSDDSGIRFSVLHCVSSCYTEVHISWEILGICTCGFCRRLKYRPQFATRVMPPRWLCTMLRTTYMPRLTLHINSRQSLRTLTVILGVSWLKVAPAVDERNFLIVFFTYSNLLLSLSRLSPCYSLTTIPMSLCRHYKLAMNACNGNGHNTAQSYDDAKMLLDAL